MATFTQKYNLPFSPIKAMFYMNLRKKNLGAIVSVGLILALVSSDAEGSSRTKPQRIVSTNLSSDEILFHILKRGGGLNRLIALSPLADDKIYSPIYLEAKTIKDRAANDLEALIKLKPDLIVVASFNRPEWLLQIKASKVPCFVVGPIESFADSFKLIYELGTLIQETEATNALLTEMKNGLSYSSKNLGQQARILSFDASFKLWAAKTLFDDIVKSSGGINILASKGLFGWPKISPEAIVGFNPDWLVAAAEDENIAAELIKQTQGFSQLFASKNQKIIAIPGRFLFSTSFGAAQAVNILRAKIN